MDHGQRIEFDDQAAGQIYYQISFTLLKDVIN